MGNNKRKRNMVKRNGKTEGLNVKGLSEKNHVQSDYKEKQSMPANDERITMNKTGECAGDSPENKEHGLLDKKKINVKKLIDLMKKNEMKYKHIEINDGDEVNMFIELLLEASIESNKDYYVGTVKCIFKNDMFLILKKMIVAKDVSASEKEAQKQFLTKKCHYGGLFRDYYSGVKCFFKDNSIYAVSIIPYPSNEIDFSIILVSLAQFWKCIEDSHIMSFEKERIGGWYCESE